MSTAMTVPTASSRGADLPQPGPSFAAALCGFLGTTFATTLIVVMISSIA